MRKRQRLILAAMILGCGVMACVDGVLQPGYGIKSLTKVILFLGLPGICCCLDRELDLKSLFHADRKGIIRALLLGVGIYGGILGGYFLLCRFLDFSAIAGQLSQNAGVKKENFLYVSIYISFVNSLLEEFFFRGFGFLNLKPCMGRKSAYFWSAGLFAIYHVAMMIGWFDLWVFLLILGKYLKKNLI